MCFPNFYQVQPKLSTFSPQTLDAFELPQLLEGNLGSRRSSAAESADRGAHVLGAGSHFSMTDLSSIQIPLHSTVVCGNVQEYSA
jgi:hypothetical protein